MRSTKWILGGLLLVSLAFNGWTYYRNYKQQQFLDIVDQKDRLQRDQMNDLTVMMYNRTNENMVTISHQQGKLEGMMAVIHRQKPDESEHSQIWHAGYYRGLDQSKDMKDGYAEDTLKVTGKKDNPPAPTEPPKK